MIYFLLDLASCTTVHAALGSARTVTVCDSQLKTRHITLLLPGHSRFEDWTHHTFIARSQPFRRLDTSHFYCPVTAVSKTGHITLLLPLSGVLCLESVMTDKMCVCVCVCVCAPTVFKLGSQIDFSVFFSAPLFGIFDVSQRTCSQNQCLFPLPLLVPLAFLSNVYAATAIISMFSSSHLDLCTAIMSNTASLPVPRFGAEHCREYCTSEIQAP